MELHQLRGFYEVARERSFTRAAERLFLTQPAISLQLKALEEELGESLFERGRKSVRLTPAGEILFRYVRQVFNRLEEAGNEIAALRDLLGGRLVIGTSDTNCTYLLPEVLEEFRDRYPQVELDIRNRMSTEVGQLVLDHEVDFGLATLPVRHRDLVCQGLFGRRDVLICPPGHALAGRKHVHLKTLAQYPLLVLERGSTSRQLLEEVFRSAGLELKTAMNLGGIEVIKRFVQIGLGLALVPRFAVGAEVEQGLVVAVQVQGLARRAVGLVEHRGRRRSPAAEAFVNLLQVHFEKAGLDPVPA
jgi:LysR family transcriptional regulator, cyn operon transcriptional activator